MRGFRPSVFLRFIERIRSRFTMTDDKDKGEGPSAANPGKSKNSRQDRLKLALRENLKRRKSQAKGRSDAASASSDDADASLDDGNGN
jgi:hypothetical protein